MLSFPIKSLREANEGAALLILQWYEMFSPDAPDTYQPKLLDIPALVDEIASVAGRAIKSQKWEKHLRLIQAELKHQCEAEKLFVARISNNYGGISEQLAAEQNVIDASSIAKLLRARRKDFEDQAIKALEESAANLPGEKESAIEALKRIGTIALDAARAAVRRIRTAIDIFNFYSHASLSFRDEVLVIDANSQSFLVSPQHEWSWQKRSNKSAKLLSKHLIGEANEKRFSGRVLNALEHYSLAQTSAAARIRLVNLWSALECLTTREDASSIMEGVCKAVVPMVTWRRTSKILSYTTKLLTEHKELAGGEFGAGFPEDEKGLSGERLMLALAKPDGHRHPEELQLFTKENVYLRYRIFTLWKTMSQPHLLANELKLTSKRVEWHLHRIYRARNLIIHEGEEVPHVGRLLENLHYYFSTTLSRILQSMQVNPTWEVTDAITYWRTRHNFIITSLTKEKAHVLRPCHFQPKNRPPSGTEPIWLEVVESI